MGFGLSVAFCIKPWVADVNVGGTYGMMAFRGRESAVYCVVGVKGT